MGVPPVRIRKDVYKLPAGDKTLEWYGKAVAEMQKRKIKDPTSWRYQAAIHGYPPPAPAPVVPAAQLPTAADRAKYWNQCQHGSWYFQPWHRGYLIYFERICRAAIVALGGPASWALPYWNYSSGGTNPDVKRIPPAFLKASVGGQPNPLFVPGRNGGANGIVVSNPAEVSVACVKRRRYTGSSGGTPGFGGLQTGFAHGGSTPGACELTPHNDMHGAVGGLMGGFNTAGLDPLFWLHHCNIDRLWEVWRARPSSLGDPTSNAWRNFAFSIHDENGAPVVYRPASMSSTTANGYKYQDISDPFPGVSVLEGIQEAPMPVEPTPPPAELAGATDESIPLGSGRASARVPIAAASALESVGGTGEGRTFLNIENITGSGPPGSYEIYVNVPEGEDPAKHPENFVGTLPLFGIGEQSSEEGTHGGSGLTIVREITDLANKLQSEGKWNESDLDVAFVPLRPVAEGSDVRIGRISVYHA
ncbi:MAG: tyrosinase [Sphingomonadales bacterium]|jgi:tyrosinase|nr:tyrosinase [Sphingomonadales bacterium]